MSKKTREYPPTGYTVEYDPPYYRPSFDSSAHGFWVAKYDTDGDGYSLRPLPGRAWWGTYDDAVIACWAHYHEIHDVGQE